MIVIFSRNRSQYHSIGSSPGFWGSLFLMNMLGGGRGGHWDDFSGGGETLVEDHQVEDSAVSAVEVSAEAVQEVRGK